jgi:deazaflavin-dependent oxidoreductase (nitroreductase family)
MKDRINILPLSPAAAGKRRETAAMKILRALFRQLNRFFMVPVFRLGLGSVLGSPFGGYVMVMKMTGRKTGKKRYVPVNYLIADGCVYCLSGFGRHSHWYYNLRANPVLDVILPGGSIHGTAEEVTDPAVQQSVGREILKASGFAAFLDGINPYSITEDKLAKTLHEMVVFRIRPSGIGAGPADYGGGAWITFWAAFILLVILLIAVLVR